MDKKILIVVIAVCSLIDASYGNPEPGGCGEDSESCSSSDQGGPPPCGPMCTALYKRASNMLQMKRIEGAELK